MSGRPDGHANEALPEETVLSVEDDGETEWRPFDEVAEEFNPGPLTRVMGPDGLPITVDQTTHSDIPALSTESLVCMGDFSAFVVRNARGEETARFGPEDVQRLHTGRWVKRLTDEHVEPIRPPCRFYVRQQGQMEANTAATQVYRLCSARRTTEGAFMSIRDYGMYACDMREPFDPVSSERLDAFDRMKIEQGRNRVHLPILASVSSPPRPAAAPVTTEVGGIFGTPSKE